MTTNAVIVDDRDLQLRGSWQFGGVAPEFKSTTAWSLVQGSTANFTFVGKSLTFSYSSVIAS
jgi:hypothetical protein